MDDFNTIRLKRKTIEKFKRYSKRVSPSYSETLEYMIAFIGIINFRTGLASADPPGCRCQKKVFRAAHLSPFFILERSIRIYL